MSLVLAGLTRIGALPMRVMALSLGLRLILSPAWLASMSTRKSGAVTVFMIHDCVLRVEVYLAFVVVLRCYCCSTSLGFFRASVVWHVP